MATLSAGRVRLVERVGSVGVGRVDRSAGVIRGVRVCGTVSKNGRYYTADALRQAVPLYEGAKVFWTHARPGSERDTRDLVGFIRNARYAKDAVYGDLYVIAESRDADMLFRLAEDHPTAAGLSHDAEGETAFRNGRTVVERIASVRSVDIVDKPATSAGLFESEGNNMRRNVREMEAVAVDGTAGVMPGDGPADGGDPVAAIEAAVEAVLAGVTDETAAGTIRDARDLLVRAISAAYGGTGDGADITPPGMTESWRRRQRGRTFRESRGRQAIDTFRDDDDAADERLRRVMPGGKFFWER